METLAYIHTAIVYEETYKQNNADLSSQLVPVSRSFKWWQMSSAATLMFAIFLGSLTRVMTAFTTPEAIPVHQQLTNS